MKIKMKIKQKETKSTVCKLDNNRQKKKEEEKEIK